MNSLTKALLVVVVVFSTIQSTAAQTISERYRDQVKQLIDASLATDSAWSRLAYITDTFGPRFSGSQNLEDAIDEIVNMMQKDGFDTVYTEPVKIPHSVRGNESVMMVAPRPRMMPMLGLGGSIARHLRASQPR